MEWLTTASLVLFSIILLIKQGLCEDKKGTGGDIHCYDCNSQSDPRCGHPFVESAFTPLNCSEVEYLSDHSKELMKLENITKRYLCRKNYQTVTLGGKTDTRIVRGCGYLSKKKRKIEGEEDEDDTEGDDRCFRRAGTFEVMVTYCTCTENNCNGATAINISIMSFLFLSIVSLLGHSSIYP